MRNITNWTYERGMQRLAWWKEEGSEVKTIKAINGIHCYRDGKYMGTMDYKDHFGGYRLKQTLN
ncbi:hypothetical protein LM99_0024 [Enterococcus phage vB_EfaS_LM99]|nr:hypothetical protein LM99_0024 [Enterococcus phage vB_EfaS_LM99]